MLISQWGTGWATCPHQEGGNVCSNANVDLSWFKMDQMEHLALNGSLVGYQQCGRLLSSLNPLSLSLCTKKGPVRRNKAIAHGVVWAIPCGKGGWFERLGSTYILVMIDNLVVRKCENYAIKCILWVQAFSVHQFLNTLLEPCNCNQQCPPHIYWHCSKPWMQWGRYTHLHQQARGYTLTGLLCSIPQVALGFQTAPGAGGREACTLGVSGASTGVCRGVDTCSKGENW